MSRTKIHVSGISDSVLAASMPPLGGVVSISEDTVLTTTALGKLHICSGTSANYAVTLPPAASCSGKTIAVSIATGTTKLVTITGNGTELINGSNTRIMWAGESATLYCDGTTWSKIAGQSLPMVAGQYQTTSQSIATGTLTKIALATGYAAHCPPAMNDTVNSKISIVRSGLYDINFSGRWNAITSSSTTYCESVLFLNGVELHNACNLVLGAATSYPQSGENSKISCTNGDFFELYMRQYTGAARSTLNGRETRLSATEVLAW